MTAIKEVFTVMLFDKDREFLDETSELPTYEAAKVVGEATLGVNSNVEYFSIERYFKRVHAAGEWISGEETSESYDPEDGEVVEFGWIIVEEEDDEEYEEDGLDYGDYYRKRF